MASKATGEQGRKKEKKKKRGEKKVFSWARRVAPRIGPPRVSAGAGNRCFPKAWPRGP